MNKPAKITLDILRRIVGTFYIPILIYIVIMMIAHSRGQTYFGNANTWRNIILNTGAIATIAYALAIQIKQGRFDFSGGATMTLGAIIAMYYAKQIAINGFLFIFMSIAICTILSFIVANIYVWGRVPIIMCTIGATILFESFTLIFNRGMGENIDTDAALNFFGKDQVAIVVVMLVSALIYFIYTSLTVSGYRARLLAHNKEAAVNIGISEKANVIQTFLVSGVLYGIAAVVFASQAASVEGVEAVLGTVGVAFRSILPVFMGFYIGSFSKDAIGIIFSSASVGILNYGIEIISPRGFSGAFQLIVYGTFVIVFFFVSHQGGPIIRHISGKWKTARKNATVSQTGI